ncbi:hypothetical protein C5167_034366 [Papaver somniferum]|uniref:Uncharacterized protein n=1 Tax=Papaver somniferum TaxID=3469 RepID=A0A4Y7KFS5_PAPSO|nr:hypothetical protein C5167_034366 [Papaver somniferum]
MRRIIIDEKCIDSVDFDKLQNLVSTTNLQQDLVNTTEFAEVVKTKEDCVFEDEEECSTPKAEDKLLQMPLVCPAAPRKPKPLKRKYACSSERLFSQVPRDLSSVFFAIPTNPKKIKVG